MSATIAAVGIKDMIEILSESDELLFLNLLKGVKKQLDLQGEQLDLQGEQIADLAIKQKIQEQKTEAIKSSLLDMSFQLANEEDRKSYLEFAAARLRYDVDKLKRKREALKNF